MKKHLLPTSISQVALLAENDVASAQIGRGFMRDVYLKAVSYALLVLVGLFVGVDGFGQTHNIPSSGSSSWTTCSGTLYEANGTSAYGNNYDGYT
ncbi:MAG: hypothetical protein KBF73_09565, partial [Flavobacteriales bacterium]|nr:hypothetical protein [Flavobacteriales bacterium]